MMNEYVKPEPVCPSCSGPSPAGGMCPSCMAIPTEPNPILDVNTLIKEMFRDDYPEYSLDTPPPETYDSNANEDAEPVCPSCNGLSETGGMCPSCMANEKLSDDDAYVTAGLAEARDSYWTPGDLTSEIDTFGHDEPLESDRGDDEVDSQTQPESQYDPVQLHDHHLMPEQFLDRFKEIPPGIDGKSVDINELTVTMYAFQHHAVHSDGFNADWAMFFEHVDQSGVQPTREDVIDYAMYLKDKYGFAELPHHKYRDKSEDYEARLF